MTAEPKFVPEDAVEMAMDDGGVFSVRLIDCVGYMVPSALGQMDGEQPRMVTTPWFDHEIPMTQAAEYGTQKVITDHSTIGIVVTTDGSVTDIPGRTTWRRRSGSSASSRGWGSLSWCCSTPPSPTANGRKPFRRISPSAMT